MKEQPNIEKLFKDHLQNIEADPGSSAWANIQTGMNPAAIPTAATTNASWASTAIVAVTITAVAVGGYFFFNNEGKKKTKNINAPVIERPVQQEEESTSPDQALPIEAQTEENNIASQEKQSTSEPIVPQEEQKSNVSAENSKNSDFDESSNNEISNEMIDQIIAEHQASLDSENEAAENESESKTEQATEQASQGNQTDATVDEKAVTEEVSEISQSELDKQERNKKVTDQVIFPNVFSPDADGRNDVFVLDINKSIPVDNIKVYIFDKSGKLVNEWSGIYNGWDGKYKDGSIAKEDSYIYKAIILIDGEEYLKVNSFNLFY